jgi:hypothetical protein
MLLATADNNGNLILWKITDNKFKIMSNISNFSESTITYLLWVPDGDILFISNSNGSLSALEFTEYSSKSSIIPNKLINLNNFNNKMFNDFNLASRMMPDNFSSFPGCAQLNNVPIHSQRTEVINTQNGVVKRIIPTMLNNKNVINQENNLNNLRQLNHNQYQCDVNLQYVQNVETQLNPNKFIQDCIRCQKQKIDSIQTKISKVKLNSTDLEKKNVYFLWENKVYDNYSHVQLMADNYKILYVNKLENKLIRLFACNNFCYVVYDTMNQMSVFTLFNTMVIETFIELYMNYLLIITGNNKIMIMYNKILISLS